MTPREELEALRRLAELEAKAGGAVNPQTQAQAEAPSPAQRIIRGLADPVAGGAQLLTKMLPDAVVQGGNKLNNWLADTTGLVAKLPAGGVDEQVRTDNAAYEAQRKAAGETGVDWLRLLGNVASPVNIALGAAAPARLATLGGRMAAGAGLGAASAATAPVTEGDFATEKAKQVSFGVAAGGALPAIAAMFGRAISPNAATNPELQLLKREGVKPTIGQSLGGAANAVEEKMQSLPIMGDAIRAARTKAQEQFNLAALNRAGSHVGAKADKIGKEGVREIGDAISDAYESGKRAMGAFQLDRQAAVELRTLRQMANNLPDRERKAFDSVWNLLDGEVSPNGHITAEGFKRFDSKVGLDASRFQGSQDAYQQQAGDAIKELQRVVVEAGKRAKPQAAKQLSKADEAWANLVRVEGAATRAVNHGGVFTPGQLGMAVRGADRSVRDRATARGTALMQDLSSAGQNVLGNKIPDSGTPTRLMYGLGGLGAGYLDPSIPIGLLAGAGAYAPPVQRALVGAATSRPASAEAIRELLNRTSPMLAPAGGLLGVEFSK